MKEVIDSNGDRHISYKSYLNSSHWKEKRKEFKKCYIRACVICGTNENIELHHITYKNIGKERLSDLCFLCRDCHESVHNKTKKVPDNSIIKTFRRNHVGLVIPKQYAAKKISPKQRKKLKKEKKKEERDRLKREIDSIIKQNRELKCKKQMQRIKNEELRNTSFEKISSVLNSQFTEEHLSLCYGVFRNFADGKYQIKCIDKDDKIIKIKNMKTKSVSNFKILY